MKNTRHIEITAFRRQVTVYSGDQPCVDANNLSPSRERSWPNIEGTVLVADLAQRCDASLEGARAGELVLQGRALIETESGSKTNMAARRNPLYSRLRRLGLSLWKLKRNQTAPSSAEKDS